jgi:hypothetical protein
MKQMTAKDVFIKGVNALDTQGNAGVLIGESASLGMVLSTWKKKKFTLIYPVGLEKLIPISIHQATM